MSQEAVRESYKSAGLQPPRLILWAKTAAQAVGMHAPLAGIAGRSVPRLTSGNVLAWENLAIAVRGITETPPQCGPYRQAPGAGSMTPSSPAEEEDVYQLPSLGLLNASAGGSSDEEDLSDKLAHILKSHGVKGQVVNATHGPVVTIYHFVPAPGVKVSKVINLSDDISLALGATRVRVAVIPGKGVVGIEVPSKKRQEVLLSQVVEGAGEAALPISVGKDVEGKAVVVDLAQMPHLLVAGTTGSGKSVAINAFITSLLFHCTPEDVRFVMIDPKMLELSVYEGIPHLLRPVVTDSEVACAVLEWLVNEMDERYRTLSEAKVRDIQGFRAKGHQMPRVVVVIDEFADLMMTSPKEVESSVVRLAQKARAAGIHLIVATQRPTVNVITGLIKANFPSRIALSVASKVDSRTILDQNGAEALLGKGDMLFSDRGSEPKRLHGCYVSEQEVSRVVEHVKQQGTSAGSATRCAKTAR